MLQKFLNPTKKPKKRFDKKKECLSSMIWGKILVITFDTYWTLWTALNYQTSAQQGVERGIVKSAYDD